MKQRKSGILLALSSLPGEFGIGGFGQQAYEFVDFLSRSKQSLWQILPLGPIGKGNSPYGATSSYAGNPLYIDLRQLEVMGLLTQEDLASAKRPPGKVDYEELLESRYALLRKAYSNVGLSVDFLLADFCNHHGWIRDYALYETLKGLYPDKDWWEWPEKYRHRDPKALAQIEEEHRDEMNFWIFTQYFFFMQWKDLKNYAASKNVSFFGDLPFYVPEDSVEVWVRPDLFLLGEDGRVAGTPPDYFTSEGQLWGFPIYNWEKMEEEKYGWWLERLQYQSSLFDYLRLDHFNAFATYWSIPKGKSAKEGEFIRGHGPELFKGLGKYFRKPNFLAEDLGSESEAGEKLRKRFGIPGMRILQFGFISKQDYLHLPHNYEEDVVAYTGTHDNDTMMGWYNTAPGEIKQMTHLYLGKDHPQAMDFVRLLMASHAEITMIPVQDLLGLDSEARMNIPGTEEGNWTWRLPSLKDLQGVEDNLRKLTTVFRRTFESI